MRYDLPHRVELHEDFDMASFGVVRVVEGRCGQLYPDMSWEPKVAFTTLATRYGS